MFRCPACHAALEYPEPAGAPSCPQCHFAIEFVDGIPLLVSDRHLLEETIADAKRQGLDAWYTQPQLGQWEGPYRHHIKKRRQWLEEVLATRMRGSGSRPVNALDLGCGDGSNLTWLHERFSNLYGSDYNVVRLQRAAKLGFNVRLFMADICNYPAEDNSFDVIFFNHVLEHIPDDAAALREVARILKPGGLLILGVPNEGAAWWQFAYRLQPKVLATSDHKHFYTAEMVAARCEAAGLSVEKTHHIGWGVPHWTLDAVVRRFKWVDDGLEWVGRRFFPAQASSLYVLLSK